ncbi:MAG: transposase [Xylophilus ampelinus]
MARLPRLSLPGQPHLLLQRGNNRQPIALDPDDRQLLRALVASHAADQRVAVHAYVLLDDAFLLLATPSGAEGLSRLMQAVGRRYVRHFNDRHRRTGTLWEGRYRSTVVQPDRHLVDCMVYLDWAPVCAGLAAEPAAHADGSYRHYAGQAAERWLATPPQVWALGNTPFAREAAYAARVREGLGADVQDAITGAVQSGWALGDADFVAGLQKTTARRLTRGRAGRPANSKSPTPSS